MRISQSVTRVLGLAVVLAALAPTPSVQAVPPAAGCINPALIGGPDAVEWREWLSSLLRRAMQRGGERTSAYYLGSPLLLGHVGADCGDEPADAAGPATPLACAEVTVAMADRLALVLDVPLPQLGAEDHRELMAVLQSKLQAGQVAQLRDVEGALFTLYPTYTRAVSAGGC